MESKVRGGNQGHRKKPLTQPFSTRVRDDGLYALIRAYDRLEFDAVEWLQLRDRLLERWERGEFDTAEWQDRDHEWQRRWQRAGQPKARTIAALLDARLDRYQDDADEAEQALLEAELSAHADPQPDDEQRREALTDAAKHLRERADALQKDLGAGWSTLSTEKRNQRVKGWRSRSERIKEPKSGFNARKWEQDVLAARAQKASQNTPS